MASIALVALVAPMSGCDGDREASPAAPSTTGQPEVLATEIDTALQSADPLQSLAETFAAAEFLPPAAADCAAAKLLEALPAERLGAAIVDLSTSFPFDESGSPKVEDTFTVITVINRCAQDEITGLLVAQGVPEPAVDCALARIDSDVNVMAALSLFSYSSGDTYQSEADEAANSILRELGGEANADVEGSARQLLMHELDDCIPADVSGPR